MSSHHRTLKLLGSALFLCVSVLSGHSDGAKPTPVVKNTYDFIVVGSGPGGGPLAANLAIAGHSVLLIEAGEDYGETLAQQVPDFYTQGIGAPESRWDFFVRYHADINRHSNYEYLTWRTPNGSYHVGQQPPANSQPLGAYYPRGGTLGGMHHFLSDSGILKLITCRICDTQCFVIRASI